MRRITALTRGPRHHFFGYYGVNSWNGDQRYHLALEADFRERRPGSTDRAAVGVIDLQDRRLQTALIYRRGPSGPTAP